MIGAGMKLLLVAEVARACYWQPEERACGVARRADDEHVSSEAVGSDIVMLRIQSAVVQVASWFVTISVVTTSKGIGRCAGGGVRGRILGEKVGARPYRAAAVADEPLVAVTAKFPEVMVAAIDSKRKTRSDFICRAVQLAARALFQHRFRKRRRSRDRGQQGLPTSFPLQAIPRWW